MKMFMPLLVSLLMIPVAATAAAINGFIVKNSPHSVVETADRMQKALEAKGIHVIGRVNHDQNAASVGLKLRPTILLIFGNPKLGTPLMAAQQTAGIDLPLKALIWQDAKGKVHIGYNDPAYIARRHHIRGQAAVIKKMSAALNKFTDEAIAR